MHGETLRQFLLAPKPEWCRGQDVAVIAYLMTVADVVGRCSPTQPELASATGAGTKNFHGIRASLDRLHQHSWITWHKTAKAIGARHTYTVHFDKLPPHPQGHPQLNLPGKEEHGKTPT